MNGLTEACCDGELAVVNQLLEDPRINPAAHNNEAIAFAALGGHYAVVDRLLEDPRVNGVNIALNHAVWKGYISIFNRLFEDPRADPDNELVGVAACGGHLVILNRLIADPRVDPKGNNNYPIRGAASNGYFEVVNRLLDDPRVDPGAIRESHGRIRRSDIIKQISNDYWYILKRKWGTCKELNDLRTKRIKQLQLILSRITTLRDIRRIIYTFLIN